MRAGICMWFLHQLLSPTMGGIGDVWILCYVVHFLKIVGFSSFCQFYWIPLFLVYFIFFLLFNKTSKMRSLDVISKTWRSSQYRFGTIYMFPSQTLQYKYECFQLSHIRDGICMWLLPGALCYLGWYSWCVDVVLCNALFENHGHGFLCQLSTMVADI